MNITVVMDITNCIDISYEDIMDFIEEGKILSNLSELFDIEINGEIDLYDSFFDTWLDDEGYDVVITEFNHELESCYKYLLENDEVIERIESIKKFNQIKYDLKYYIDIIKETSRGDKYSSKKIEGLYFYGESIDYDKETIKLYGVGENRTFRPEIVTFDQIPYFFTGMYLKDFL